MMALALQPFTVNQPHRLLQELWETKGLLAMYLLTVWYIFPGSFQGLWYLLVYAPSAPFFPKDTGTSLWLAGFLCLELLMISLIWYFFTIARSNLPRPWRSIDISWVLQSCSTLDSTPLSGLFFVLAHFGPDRHAVRRATPWHVRHSVHVAWAALILFGWVKFCGIDALFFAGLVVIYLAAVALLLGQVQASFAAHHTESPLKIDYRHKPRYALAAVSQALFFGLTLSRVGTQSIWANTAWLAMPSLSFGTFILYLKHAHEADNVNMSRMISRDNDEIICQVCITTIFAEVNADKGNVHHATIASLKASAQSGCRICAAVWQAANHIDKDFVANLMFWRPATAFDNLRVELNGTSVSFNLRSLQVPDRWARNLDIRERIAPETLPYHTGSEQSLQQARMWLHNCTVFHGVCCANHDHTFRPSRLLFVDNRSVRIQEIEDMPARVDYLTLSHRWGEAVPLKLLEHKLDLFREDIAWAELPRTFRDAIRITRYFGYSYIWIDSLCIIQDSKPDWKHEAALMGRIYRNSACNIAASSALDSTHGCLYLRNSRTLQPELVSVDSVEKYLINDTDVYGQHIIYDRAWILQEAFLARRTLDCGRGQLFWRCGEMRASEVFPGGVPTNIFRDDHPASKFKVISAENDQVIVNANVLIERLRTKKNEIRAHSGKTSLEQYTDSPYAFWRHLVDHYTKLDITFETDRIIAFAGIVDVFRPFFGEYWHGLWQTFMPAGLLWTCGGRQRSEHEVPSWSWMFIEGPVTLFTCNFKYGKDVLLSNFLGLADDDGMRLRFSTFLLNGSRGYRFLEFDLPKEGARVEEFFLMCVVVNKERGSRKTSGLIVEQVGGRIYRRLGYFADSEAQLLPLLKMIGKTEIVLV